MVEYGVTEGVIFPEEDDIFNIHARCTEGYRAVDFSDAVIVELTIESLENTIATSIKTCSSTIEFLLEDKGDYKLYSLERSLCRSSFSSAIAVVGCQPL